MTGLTEFAKEELDREGLFDKDVYDGMIGKSVMELIEVFSKQGHSGYSAFIVREIFYKLSNFKPLNNNITNNSDEWNEVGDGFYQNKRNPSIFTNDVKYYYDIDDKRVKWYKLPFTKTFKNSRLKLYKIEVIEE